MSVHYRGGGGLMLLLSPLVHCFIRRLSFFSLIEVQMDHILQTLLVGINRLDFIYDEVQYSFLFFFRPDFDVKCLQAVCIMFLNVCLTQTDPPQTIQEAASSLQAKFIDFVRIDKEARTLARKGNHWHHHADTLRYILTSAMSEMFIRTVNGLHSFVKR